MPKCSNCDVKQGRLNEGNLCKSCFDNRNKTLIDNTANKHIDEIPQMDINSLDRNVINFLKTNMEHEQKRELELTALLRDHIEYLKHDIEFLKKELASKDKIIDLLSKDNYIDDNDYNENNNDANDDLFIYPKRSTRVHYGPNEDNGNRPIKLYNRFNLLNTSPSNGDKINDYGLDHATMI